MNLEEFLVKFPPPGRLVFAKVWGSRSHNTHKPTSDTDFSGVYLYPTRELLSVRLPNEKGLSDNFKFDKEEGANHNKEDWPDYQFFEVGRFAELLLKGNPSIIEMLFTDNLTLMTPTWERLRAIRDRFLCQESVKQYVGYMQGQLRRLTAHDGKKGLHTKGGGYNEKWAYHILRLAEDAKRIATGQCPVVWKEGPERDFLMRVRNNEFDWPDVKVMLEKAIYSALNTKEPMPPWEEKKAYEQWLDKSLSALPIPQYGDKDALNDWLWQVRQENP